MHCFMVEFYALLTQYKQYPSVAVTLFVLGKDLFYLLLYPRIFIFCPLLYMVIVSASRQL